MFLFMDGMDVPVYFYLNVCLGFFIFIFYSEWFIIIIIIKYG